MKLLARIISLAIIAAAVYAGITLQKNVSNHPSTDNASIDAEVVHIASQVGGRIVEIAVEENDKVKKGDLLFRIDPEAYELAVQQAQANLDVALAALDTRKRALVSEALNARIAAEEKQKAETNLELATRTTERLKPLAEKSYVPAQQFDEARTAQRDAAASLQQARKQQSSAEQIIGNEGAATANVRATQAALEIVRKALKDTKVRAPHDGRIVGLSVKEGETVAPSQSLFTLIVTDEWHAVANFQETELPNIREGDCATVYSMVNRTVPIHGVVDGIGWGVMDSERINLPKSAPYVEKSLNWVRVAQRFPVRVRLIRPPENAMRLGASAVVEIKRGERCK